MSYKILSGVYSNGYALKPTYTGVSVTHSGVVTALAASGRYALETSNGVPVVNEGRLVGGSGAAGVTGAYYPSSGGGGGPGLKLAAGGSVLNTGYIGAGTGGRGGPGDAGYSVGGPGGPSDAAVAFYYGSADTNTLVNRGVIRGAAGGVGGTGYGGAPGGYGGDGGPGVDFVGVSQGYVQNLGSIFGGDYGAAAPGGSNHGHAIGGGGVIIPTDGRLVNGGPTDSSALIAGGNGAYGQYSGQGVFMRQGTITNYGTLRGGTRGYGVEMYGGLIVNKAGGVIDGIDNQGAVTVQNAGTIAVTGTLNESGVLTNTGTITVQGVATAFARFNFIGDRVLGGGGVIDLEGDAAIGAKDGSTLTSDNTIVGAGNLHVGSGLTNAASGVIDATGAMFLNAIGGTVTNNGLIETTRAGVLSLENATLDDNGHGRVTVGNVLDFDGGAIDGGTFLVKTAGTLNAIGTAVTIDLGGRTIANAGLIDAAAVNLTLSGPIDNTGVLRASGGSLILNGVTSGDGVGQIGGGVLQIGGAFGEGVTFGSGATGRLDLADWRDFTGVVSGFSATGANSIDLRTFAFVAGKTSATFSGSAASGVLTVTNGALTTAIDLTGDYLAATFAVTANGTHGVIIRATAGAATAAAITQAFAAFGASRDAIAPTAATTTPARPTIALASPGG